MLNLHENEKILMVLRKHWFELSGAVAAFALALVAAPLVLTFLPLLPGGMNEIITEAVVNFFLSLYIMVLSVFLFYFWADYYLDMWIITTERIIDINQLGLFSREISEIPLRHVQDVTIEVHGIIETFLKFGTIRIQTAGEREFIIHDVPDLYEAKDLILKYSGMKNGSGK